ncbi:MAG TPA: dodecin [Solirubrobacteraceae bacterium]|nr:dodecin [Solirubrobacteraceae bacterium]
MSDHVYQSAEITGSSSESITEAIANAVKRASASMPNLNWFEVQNVRGVIDGDRVGYYQVTVKIGYRLD